MKNKRIFALIMCFLVFFSFCPIESPAAGSSPRISTSNYILINMDTGEILLEKNSNEKRYPASTTKIMTALLALENLDLDATTTVSYEAFTSIPWDSSKLGIYEGETFSNYNLIKGMMVVSGNDAANVLAEAVSGSISDFVALMNKRAKELGCTGTNFANAHGYTDENHYTTAADMAKIAKKAMENTVFREIVRTTYFELPATEIYDEIRYYNTTNNLLTSARTTSYLYSPATGIKTGYTSAAKSCLVASAEKEGVRLISVVLGASNINGVNMAYVDTKALMEWGFENYVNKKIVKKGEVCAEKKIKYSLEGKTVKLVAKEDFSFTMDKNADASLMEKKIIVGDKFKAPVTTEDNLGVIEIYYDGNLLGSVSLTADKNYNYSEAVRFMERLQKVINFDI